VRRRLLRVFVRRGLLLGDDARAMAQWQHEGGFSADGSVRFQATDRAGRESPAHHRKTPPQRRATIPSPRRLGRVNP
jgi:hypothetical protein